MKSKGRTKIVGVVDDDVVVIVIVAENMARPANIIAMTNNKLASRLVDKKMVMFLASLKSLTYAKLDETSNGGHMEKKRISVYTNYC
jgi:phage FluMu gp28-like protein